jgi:hypothetical protein
MARSTEIHTRLWPITEELARSAPDSQVLALFIESLNETIDLHETRVIAGVYTRVPETILILLLLGALLTLGGMVGYSAGLTQRRSDLAGIVLIVILGGVITLIVDLDRPRDGFVRVSVQPLMDLQGQIGAPEMTRLD